MSTPVTVVALLRAKPGCEQQLREALDELVRVTRQEPGCINYDLHRSTDDPRLFVFHENWTDAGSLDAHLQAEHIRHFNTLAPDLLATDPELHLLERLD